MTVATARRRQAGGRTLGPTWGGPAAAAAADGRRLGGPVSRGYREEMEHFAYCVSMLERRRRRRIAA